MIVALLAGLVAYVVTFWIGLYSTISSECDGICFDTSDEIGLVAIAVAIPSGLACGWLTHRAITKRRNSP